MRRWKWCSCSFSPGAEITIPSNRRHAPTVLLALHYQNETVHPEGKIRVGIAEASPARAAVIAAARRLLSGARARQVPVISVRIAFRPDHADVAENAEIWRRVKASGATVEGSWGAEFYEGLGPDPREFVVTHQRNNAFYGSPLADIVRGFRPERLVIAGISTTYVVESTVRHAADMGYRVTVAADACSSSTAEMHEASLKAMALLAEISTVDAIVAGFAVS
ncbi:MAG TPA: isochorismatase family cysteine hydrolase [Stellaceae bacterium]|nr:isochorismatase family cysteine hydrolase [Stellaceae bacterium]